MNQISNLHRPVLLERCMELLDPAISHPGAVVIDGTLGLGGHSQAMLERYPGLTVLGIDRDPRALELASERLSSYAGRFIPIAGLYSELDELAQQQGFESVDGVLLDLGVSSMQLDEPDRGFAYSQDVLLDMRMNPQVGKTASDLLAELDESQLIRIFRDYGEERYAPGIAKKIVKSRLDSPITRSSQLNQIVQSVIPASHSKNSGHPAKRIYQALRIAVNDELAILEKTMPRAIDILRPGGRLVVMSYHSLEDGIVKRALQLAATSSTPIEMPVQLPGTGPTLRVITRGVERAEESEISSNPRASSARLRAAEKLEAN